MVEHLKVMAALTVEHAYASLSVEHLKVMAASRACLRIQFTYWVGGLWSSASGPYGRAPKGDGGLISRACLRILSMAALSVEHLKVMAASRACLRIL